MQSALYAPVGKLLGTATIHLVELLRNIVKLLTGQDVYYFQNGPFGNVILQRMIDTTCEFVRRIQPTIPGDG